MDSATLNNRLKDRAADVVMHIFPSAKIKGNIAHVGSLDGEAGDSFTIHVSGSRIGMWTDFSKPEDKGGSLLWLWSKAKGLTYTAAVAEAKAFMGIKDDDYGLSSNKPKKSYSAPDKKGLRALDTNTKAMDYLCITRKLDPIVVAANKISETPDGETIVFPYIDEAAPKLTACHLKYLAVDREKDPATGKEKKKMWASKDTKRCLFSKQTVPATSSYLVLSEGEIDAMSWQSLQQPCCSIPMGVNDVDWIELDWSWLERFEIIYLSFDMDAAGGEAVERIAKRLGLHRVRVITLPQKDMNKCLTEGFTAAEAQKALDEAKAIEIAEIQAPTAYLDEVWNVFHPTAGQHGYATPWWPQLPFRVKPAELTILSGYSGAGKTCWINNLIISILNQGGKVLDCSLEIKPARTLQWMARQALNKRTPDNKEELEATLQWLAGGVWLFDYVGTANITRMFEAMLYSVKRYGVNVIFIDSLFKCGIGSDDYNAQKDFIAKLCDFCRDTGVHVFLVAHTRKPPINTGGRNEDRVPSKDEIAGSADIQNGAFNILIVWRNKEKHKKLDELRQSANPSMEAVVKWEAAPDGRVKLDKSRFDGIEREVATWFDLASTQFTLAQTEKPVTYFRHSRA
jgi:twinkle protein